MTLALLSLLLASDPCAPIERSAPDPALALVYAKVAREDEREGEGSAAAWRLAAQLEPAGAAGEQALRRLCLQATHATAFARGRELFDSHDCLHALPFLREARHGPDDASVALLEGICAWELGDDANALAALTVAREDRELTPTAELFLGLLALRQGDHRSALALLRTAASSESQTLRSTAGELLRLADRKERLIIEAAAEAGYDSNATASAFATVLPGGADDGFAAATARLTLRRLGENGPTLVVGGGYRKQFRFSESDVGLAAGALGWQLGLGRVRASLDYGLDFVALGGAPWMVRHRGTVRALLALGVVVLSAEYALGHETLWAESVKADTGFRHAGRAAASLRFDNHLLELSGLVTRAQAATADRRSIEAGGELRWVVRLQARLDFEAAIGARWRGFDAVDPELGLMRRELQLDARGGLGWDLDRDLTLFVALEGQRVASSVAELTHTRLAASAGLRFSMGVW